MTDRPAPPTIRLLVFSGRPNPEWEAAPELVADLTERFVSLGAGEPTDREPSYLLGYRGFDVMAPGHDPLPERLRVSPGLIFDESHTPAVAWEDAAGIEALLLADARQAGYAAVVPESS